jgi:predicted transcriptional regulator
MRVNRAVESSMSLYDCLNLMTKWKVHRVPVVDSMGTLLTSISQSSIVKFLCRIISKFSVAEKTVEELKLGYKTVVVSHQKQVYIKLTRHRSIQSETTNHYVTRLL